jgi:hypothetical protein
MAIAATDFRAFNDRRDPLSAGNNQARSGRLGAVVSNSVQHLHHQKPIHGDDNSDYGVLAKPLPAGKFSSPSTCIGHPLTGNKRIQTDPGRYIPMSASLSPPIKVHRYLFVLPR